MSSRWFGWNDTSIEGGAAESSRCMTRGACIEKIGQLADIATVQNSPPHRDAAKEVVLALKQSIELVSYYEHGENAGISESDRELFSEEFCIAALNAVSGLCEQYYVKIGSQVGAVAATSRVGTGVQPGADLPAELGRLGTVALADQVLGLKIASSAPACFAALRAMSLLIGVDMSESPTSQRMSLNRTNLLSLCSSGSIYRVLKVGVTYLSLDNNVLVYSLRVINSIAKEKGKRFFRDVLLFHCSIYSWGERFFTGLHRRPRIRLTRWLVERSNRRLGARRIDGCDILDGYELGYCQQPEAWSALHMAVIRLGLG